MNTDTQIFSSRILDLPIHSVYEAFSDPTQLAPWWGPEGFTNTIHEFDLHPGGKWLLTMHGPEKGNYANASEFEIVEPFRLIAWKRISQPWFNMEVGFRETDEGQTEISFRMIFHSKEACDKIRPFGEPKNEENFDRLERLLAKGTFS